MIRIIGARVPGRAVVRLGKCNRIALLRTQAQAASCIWNPRLRYRARRFAIAPRIVAGTFNFPSSERHVRHLYA